MSFKATTVKLVNGEEVQLAIDSVCNQKQTFVRMGNRLIAGVVDDSSWQGIYIWQEVNGVYKRLGDIVFHEQDDDSVLWSLYLWTHNTSGFEQKAAQLIAEQGKTHASGYTTGNHVELLSIAPGVPV